MQIIKYDEVQEKIIEIRAKSVELYCQKLYIKVIYPACNILLDYSNGMGC